MKALCITGADNATLEAIAAPFCKAGMQLPKPLEREKEINFARWHQQVGDQLAKKQPIGKLWENIASDLLLANLESELWGWYEEQSVKALNFWADLEPSIHFLLVCTRPEDELCQKISQAEGPVDAEAFIKDWHQRHSSMLQFYLKHPQRCLLIDAQDALQHLNKQLLLAHDHWQLPLDQETAEQQVETPAESEQTQEPTSEIVSLVARAALKHVSTEITDLYKELRAAQYPLTGLEESEATTRKLLDWLKKDTDMASLNQLLTEYQGLQQQANLAKQLPLLQDQSQNTQQSLEEAEEENKLQLMQLQQVKEELQYYFQKKQELQAELEEVAKQKEDALHQNHLNVEAKKAAELQVKKISRQLDEGKQENELLLLQLHQVQEELESCFLQNQNMNKKQEELRTALQEAAKQKEDALHQNHLNAEARKTAELKAKETTHQLDESKQESELLLLQLHQVQEELEHYFLQNQKTSDELTQLKQDNRKLKHQNKLANQQAAAPKGLFARKAKKTIPSLEFEGVQLCHEQVNPDYEHLWISLQSPCFGEHLADRWHFRISCAGVKPGEFGQQPKLELPEQKDQLLAQWFSESESEHGHNLELRFALPNAMDTRVWKQISLDDQQLIKALLRQLPDIISELKNQNTWIHRNWGDWEALVADMQRINEAKG